MSPRGYPRSERELIRDAIQSEAAERLLPRRRRGRKTSNLLLRDLPDDRAVIQAVADLAAVNPRADMNITAQRIAYRLGVEGARRHGRGAVAHSWTGTMAPALRIAPRLRSLEKRGLLWSLWDRERYRRLWGVTRAGHALLEEAE